MLGFRINAISAAADDLLDRYLDARLLILSPTLKRSLGS